MKEESAHKLRKTIESLKKDKKKLENKNNELTQRLEIKQKTGKVNHIILNREKPYHKFQILSKKNAISFTIKRKKNKKDKFSVSNNIDIITKRLYPKKDKSHSLKKEKDNNIIIIRKENNQLNKKSLSSNKFKNIKNKNFELFLY